MPYYEGRIYMKTKTLLALLSISILFAGCGASTETTVERASTSPETTVAEAETSSESSPDSLAEEKLLSVEVTIPAMFYEEDGEEMTQEKVDQTVSDNGFMSGVLNSDGSVTFSMSKSQHDEFLQSLKDSTEEMVVGFVDGDNRIESFTKITYNDDLSEFKVYVDPAVYTSFDSISAVAFYFAGQYYQLFSGVPYDDTEVVIEFINKDTDEIIETGSLSQFRENAQSSDDGYVSEEASSIPEDDSSDGIVRTDNTIKEPVYSNPDVNITVQTGPIVYTIDGIQVSKTIITSEEGAALLNVEKDKELALVVINVTVENTSDDTINFYMSQATLTTNTKEQVENNPVVSEYIDGEYLGNVIHSGNLVYILQNSNAEEITDVKLYVDSPADSSFSAVGEDTVVEIVCQ